MASPADIVNRALSHLGLDPTVVSLDGKDASREAVQARLWYHPVRRQMLESGLWNFATRQTSLEELEEPPTYERWSIAYRWPADCVRVIRLLDLHSVRGQDITDFPAGGGFSTGPVLFRTGAGHTTPSVKARTDPTLGGPGIMEYRGVLDGYYTDYQIVYRDSERVILSNIPNALAEYVADLQEPGEWSDQFTQAFVALLASHLAMPLTNEQAKQQAALQLYAHFAKDAATRNAQESRDSYQPDAAWIRARRSG